ncbi:MAG: signal peptidase I [Coriobacteriia bacterium]|nr:signal peptidase I [Coriobacteriia bacterium]MBN2840980.1 signal peptidase I [Coriobacteriia bacterium]
MDEHRFILWRDSDRRVVVLASVLAVALGIVVSLLYVVYTTVRISGPSMEPALYDEDRVLITRGYDVAEHDDIVSAVVPDEHGQPVRVIKRVVALAGDTVEIHGDRAYVNGERVPGGANGDASGAWIPAFEVPAGHVFVLGDNRSLSYDSREVGPVPVADIRGKVVAVILPLHRFSIID